MPKPTIVTFSGKAQHGKDTSASILKNLLEAQNKRVLIINYGDYLKYLAMKCLGWDGNKDEKGRTILQILGTEKVRNRFPDFWVNTVIDIAKIFEDDYDFILIADCRFPNEINRWLEESYNVISFHVFRPGFDNGLTPQQKAHVSETALDDFDAFKIKIESTTLDELNTIIRMNLSRITTMSASAASGKE
jgi:hypothetical protein